MARASLQGERREQILEGLFAAMATHGSLGTSVTEIAKAAGIARGALHYYFDSKDEIRAALMGHLGANYTRGLERALAQAEARATDDVGGDVLSTLVRWHFAGDHDRNARLLSVWIDFWGQAQTDPSLQAVVLEVQERARTLCDHALLCARPELLSVAPSLRRHFAATMLALVEGGLLQWRVAHQTERALDRELLAQQLTDALRALVYALPPPSTTTSIGAPS
jgi:AcrR family transcriptional regulator